MLVLSAMSSGYAARGRRETNVARVTSTVRPCLVDASDTIASLLGTGLFQGDFRLP